jgi:transposase
MIKPEKRKAIYVLFENGMPIRDISRQLRVNRNTVRSIIRQRGIEPERDRNDRIRIDSELLNRLYGECEGFIQRIHEKLLEEENIQVGYSTLSRMIRDLGLGQRNKNRCSRVPDEPGAEMQHDTSKYHLVIGDKKLWVIGSLLYFRYSKRRYVKFYRSFNRFRMKCFFHEALTHFGYTAQVCVIDNTNLARLRGTGKNAIMTREMEEFSRRYGFEYICHEVGHANRKAGNERGFYTVETNFFPGRKFETMEDLNQQAHEWATIRIKNRPMSKTGLIPAKAFEYEKPYLKKLPPFVPEPYRCHKRQTDQYGCLNIAGV